MSQEELGALVRLRVDALSLHPACKLVPEMTNSEWTEFLADVGRRGIQEPLVVDEQDQILDGRHRHRAAGFAETETVLCRRVEFDEAEKTRFVLGAALHRRNLTIDQRAMMAAKYRERLTAEAKAQRSEAANKIRHGEDSAELSLSDGVSDKEKTEKRDTIREASQAFDVPERKTRSATSILKNADSRIADAVDTGQITLACAKTLAQLPPHRQEVIAAGGPAAMKNAARLAVHSPPEAHEEEADEGDRPAPVARDERRERVERMAILQRFRSFHKEVTDFLRGRDFDEAIAGWPEEQLDELYDYADRITKELAAWTSALEGGR